MGAATDLDDLKNRADNDPKLDVRIDALRRAVAALEADTVGAQSGVLQRFERILTQATGIAATLAAFDGGVYVTC